MVARLQILPKFQTLLEVMLRSLAEDGVVRLHADEIEFLKSDFLSVEEVAGELATRFPRFVPLAELVSHCVGSYRCAQRKDPSRYGALSRHLRLAGCSDGSTAPIIPAMRFGFAPRRISLRASSPTLAIRRASLKSEAAPAGSLLALRNSSPVVLSNTTSPISAGHSWLARERAQERGFAGMRFAPLDISPGRVAGLQDAEL